MKLQPLHRKAEGLLFCWGVFYILSPVGSFLPIAAESLPRRVSRSPATLRHGNRDTATGGYSEVVSKERRQKPMVSAPPLLRASPGGGRRGTPSLYCAQFSMEFVYAIKRHIHPGSPTKQAKRFCWGEETQHRD